MAIFSNSYGNIFIKTRNDINVNYYHSKDTAIRAQREVHFYLRTFIKEGGQGGREGNKEFVHSFQINLFCQAEWHPSLKMENKKRSQQNGGINKFSKKNYDQSKRQKKAYR